MTADEIVEAVARVLHRWKHPTMRLGEGKCRCRDDAKWAAALEGGES